MIKKVMKLSLCFMCLLTLTTSATFANPASVTNEELQELTTSISTLMKSNYVFPAQAEEMANLITNNTKSGKYRKLTNPKVLSEQLTKDLHSINNDLHIRVEFEPERIAQIRAVKKSPKNQQTLENDLKKMRRINYGFKEVKILKGNIGYINITSFTDPKFGGETAEAAMNFVANTDAIIFDLRENRGGYPAMVQLISSYLFDAEPVHLNSLYWRPSNKESQSWTIPYVSGKRNIEANVYILISKYTFSAAEEFSYNLKNLQKATLIGETTGGGAHPGSSLIATDRFTVWVPQGRAISPITHTNWEGTGVTPHISVSKDNAFNIAYQKALETLEIKAH